MVTYFDKARWSIEEAIPKLEAFLNVLKLAFQSASKPVDITLFVEAWLRVYDELYWQAFHIACQEGVATQLLLVPEENGNRLFLVFKDERTDEQIHWEQAAIDETLYSLIAGCTRPVIVLDRISHERFGRSWFQDLTVNPDQIEGVADPFVLEPDLKS